jgi:hypothetical protein
MGDIIDLHERLQRLEQQFAALVQVLDDENILPEEEPQENE